MAIMALIVITAAGISCKRSNAPAKEGMNLPPEHAKAVEAVKKSLNESKNVPAARVNGSTITMFDLVSEMNAVAPNFIKPGQQRDPKIDEKVKKEALDRLIYRELAIQDAVRQGLKVPPANLDEAMMRFKTGLKTEGAYREYLAKSSLTEDELKKQMERNMLVHMITEKEIFDKIKIDPALVKKTYAKEKGSYRNASGQMSFEEARPLIEEKLMTPRAQKREDEWVESLRKSAKIEIVPAQSLKEIHSLN